jgi:T3SS (YopN, CesT) and YbjN peptide-binding chaperone 1/T3SS (YopN, CesT) and YbjN peptide-binding chaperone 3
MAEIDGFDLDRSTAQAWSEFQGRLAEVVSMIDDSGDLTIGTDTGAAERGPFVRFSSPARNTVRAEAASNAELGDHFQLEAGDLAAMTTMGWQPPRAGSTPNFWLETSQEDSDRVAELAVAALRDVYRVQHPVFLAPDQLAEVLHPPAPIEDAERRVERAVSRQPVELRCVLPRDRRHLNELVDAELAEIYGHPPIRDEVGDVAIRVGSTMVFLRTASDAQEVVVFAAVVHDLEGRSRAAEVLNDLNVEARWVKFQLVRDRVFVTISVPAKPFVSAHLHQAVRIMSDVADGIDDELAAKLRGRTTFSDPDDDGC